MILEFATLFNLLLNLVTEFASIRRDCGSSLKLFILTWLDLIKSKKESLKRFRVIEIYIKKDSDISERMVHGRNEWFIE